MEGEMSFGGESSKKKSKKAPKK